MELESEDDFLAEHPLGDIVGDIETLIDSASPEQDPNSDTDAVASDSRRPANATLDACLNFYQQVKKETHKDAMEALLEAAWSEDPRVALRLIFRLRDTRRGEGLREHFLICLFWLRRRNHYRTFLYNLAHVDKVGYWKDLLELVIAELMGLENYLHQQHDEKRRAWTFKYLKKSQREGKADKKKSFGQLRREVFAGRKIIDKEEDMATAKKAFDENPEYRMIHVRVASLFADQLLRDLAELQAGRPVSPAGKWSPSCCKRHDRLTLISSTIAQMVYPRGTSGIAETDYKRYMVMAKVHYRTICLAPLRARFHVAEQFMSDNRWDEIVYERVPSVCMKRNRHLFEKNSRSTFQEYLDESEGKKEMTSESASKPYASMERIRRLIAEEIDHEALQSQWDALVKKLKETDCFLTNSLAVCGVPDSARGQRPPPGTVMSLLIAELARVPFKGQICEHSYRPGFFSVPNGSLNDKVTAVRKMNRDYPLAIEDVFALVLKRAVETNTPKEDMIRRIFVFSKPYSFHFPSGNSVYEESKRQFSEAGYELPEVIAWICSGAKRQRQSEQPIKIESGGIHVSGYSKALCEIFTEGKIERLDDYSTMLHAVQPYDYVRVLD